jgi:hypothetical protein
MRHFSPLPQHPAKNTLAFLSSFFFSPLLPPPVFFLLFRPSKKRKMLGKWGNRFISRSLPVGYAFPHIFPSGEKLGDVGWCRSNRFGLWGWRSRSGWGWPVGGVWRPVAAPSLRVWPSLAIAPFGQRSLLPVGLASGQSWPGGGVWLPPLRVWPVGGRCPYSHPVRRRGYG